ncbi:cell division protein FtsQ/DivIB [Halobacillus litoralis]|uniref:cell division protein FtsQ/DivIB n=1 Tax=Halobacillus litoralis TaxID=45668 RepID=UPI001CD2C940|nr:cell division protein FtsQ/DivIB [Halobacillus litoralis]MCA0969366.1 cell division protein FtsQ/DivIB [Halobacillus litoralis]
MNERKVVSIEERIPRLKQTRKNKANRRLIFYLSILFMLIGLVIYLQSSLSHVRHIVVTGAGNVSEEEVTDLSGVTTDTNFWQVDADEIIKNIESHEEIIGATVSRDFPSTVEIEVEEAERIGYIVKNGQYRPILEDGTQLKATSTPPGDAPILAGFTKATYLKEMSKELKELPESVAQLISEIHWVPKEENPYQIRLYMNDGYQVLASIRNFSSKMPSYPSIVAQLEPGSEGIIHIDVGAYFEEFPNEGSAEQENTNEAEG